MTRTLLNSLNDQQMTLTLQNALRSGPARTLARDYGFKSAIAGMPGYSEGYRDAWFVGYTPKVLAGVWVGYDDSRPHRRKDVAVKSAVPLWGEIMQQIEARDADRRRFSRSARPDQGRDRPLHRRPARPGRAGPRARRHFCLSEEGAGRRRGQHDRPRRAANPGAAGMDRLADDDVQPGG